MKILYKLSSFLLVFSLVILPTAPAFAQLGDVTPPPVEAPAPEPAPAPVVESAPVVEPVPEAAPTTEGLEPEVQTTTEVSTPTTESGPEVSAGTSGVTVTDTIAPTISGVADLSLGLSEATIVWTTDELATSRLEYGTTQSYGQNATLDASALLAHTAIILNLTPNTTYYYCVHATDLVGNTRNSCGHSFRTATPSSDGGGTSVIVDTTPPDISVVTVTSISSDSVTINWTTDSVANSEV
ncbi:MAG: hypothetical protein Q7R89_00405, partial [bacterium]|nr:hypothetical protein [bacterium]